MTHLGRMTCFGIMVLVMTVVPPYMFCYEGVSTPCNLFFLRCIKTLRRFATMKKLAVMSGRTRSRNFDLEPKVAIYICSQFP